MNYSTYTKIAKDCRNEWHAETRQPLTDNDTENRILILTTMKRYGGGVSSTFKVVTVANGMETWAVFGSYSKHLPAVKYKRVTEKTIREHHDQGLSSLPEALQEALAFYADKGAK